MSFHHVVVRASCCVCRLFLLLDSLCLPASTELFRKIRPLLAIDLAAFQQSVDNEGTTHLTSVREIADSRNHFVPVVAQLPKLVHLGFRQKNFTCDVIAELFDLLLEISSAQTSTSKPDMRQLVKQRERPRDLRILIVDNDERRYFFCQREALKISVLSTV